MCHIFHITDSEFQVPTDILRMIICKKNVAKLSWCVWNIHHTSAGTSLYP